ncbi:hypothetical protein TD95_004608 [Thielaviopsis punctulata]|uniref:DUF1304-domain-containing protein n=1 Tax=Thielaviopsis punctulata TaxID=72032 RepID=A0A0F4ZH23_9PEZI|nr:hypothetical protein TD95_004608 [Thielaviopsis punctulata]
MSSIAASALAALHGYIAVLEIFLWTKPAGRRAFNLKPEFAQATKVLGANQGIYNVFLAAGLAWSVVHPDADFAHQLRVFFAGCVATAGVFGAVTSSKKILMVQGVPGFVTLGLTMLGF